MPSAAALAGRAARMWASPPEAGVPCCTGAVHVSFLSMIHDFHFLSACFFCHCKLVLPASPRRGGDSKRHSSFTHRVCLRAATAPRRSAPPTSARPHFV